MIEALRRLALAVIGVFALAMFVAPAPAVATPAEISTESKHWVE